MLYQHTLAESLASLVFLDFTGVGSGLSDEDLDLFTTFCGLGLADCVRTLDTGDREGLRLDFRLSEDDNFLSGDGDLFSGDKWLRLRSIFSTSGLFSHFPPGRCWEAISGE